MVSICSDDIKIHAWEMQNPAVKFEHWIVYLACVEWAHCTMIMLDQPDWDVMCLWIIVRKIYLDFLFLRFLFHNFIKLVLGNYWSLCGLKYAVQYEWVLSLVVIEISATFQHVFIYYFSGVLFLVAMFSFYIQLRSCKLTVIKSLSRAKLGGGLQIQKDQRMVRDKK